MKKLRASVVAFLCALFLLTASGPVSSEPLTIPGIPVIPGVPTSIPEIIDALIPPPPVPPAPMVLPPIAALPSGQTEAAPDMQALRLNVMPSDVGDPFFDHWPSNLADFSNGQVIESRDVTATAAWLVAIPVERVVQLKFRTSDSHGAPSFATATLVVPAVRWTGDGSRPVLVSNLPIDALGRACTPGYTMAHGYSLSTNATDFVPPTTQLAALRGYAVLIPDHQGPRMAYAEPYVAGKIVLDSIKAVRTMLPVEFAQSRYALHGYSGGAIATHGALKLIAIYAPELSGLIVGGALGGVPADFEMLSRSMNGNLASGVFLGAVFAIGREHPEILAKMNHLAQWVATSPMKDQCIEVFAAAGALMLPIDIAANIEQPLMSELARDIYALTGMDGMKSVVPMYIYNGAQEFWIPAEGARNLYSEQCGLGTVAVYREVPGEHVIAAGVGYPEALWWLDQRLQGIPALSEC